MKHYEMTDACFEAIDKRMLNHEKAKDLARELTGCFDPIEVSKLFVSFCCKPSDTNKKALRYFLRAFQRLSS